MVFMVKEEKNFSMNVECEKGGVGSGAGGGRIEMILPSCSETDSAKGGKEEEISHRNRSSST